MSLPGSPRRPGHWLGILILAGMGAGCGLLSLAATASHVHSTQTASPSVPAPSSTLGTGSPSSLTSSTTVTVPIITSSSSALPTTRAPIPSPTVAPGLVSLLPEAGPPGTVVTFVGVGFGTNPGRVVFLAAYASQGGTDLAIRAWTPTRIEATVPMTLAAGNYTPELWTAAGTPVGPTSDAAWPIFTVTGPVPKVTGLSPASAPAGSLITITGDNFGSTPGRVTLCQFCGTLSAIDGTATIVSWTPTEVLARVPGMQNGVAEVHLTTAAGQVVLAGSIATGGAPSSTGGGASG